MIDATPEVRADVLAALAALLERGIVVEPYGTNWTGRMGAVRIRLAPEQGEDHAEGTGAPPISW